jgi:hypothetical protein
MLACEAVVPFDAHAPEDPADPCPVCMGPIEDGVCFLCGVTLCEDCGYAEVGRGAASCVHCAPVYAVETLDRPYYLGRNLRRAWEAQGYLHNAGLESASITVPTRLRPDHDGLTAREIAVLESWDDAFMRVHTCIAPSKVRP